MADVLVYCSLGAEKFTTGMVDIMTRLGMRCELVIKISKNEGDVEE